ncbi:hypothetical protein RJZ56_002739 [Blastomyces dermatitidis]|uniref:Uncharacterized protein n=2 Tax=Blastomyces TaxID=229219 RepID=A0A179UPS3_BLAGS|nr:uncharacterized protein BDBG_05758 [Blastomyces gilchristii SLH14081]XP_045274710.1 uncharacterized protein BDCG_02496 [Blastomyces dermatitidis ER-3]EEQ87376.1 hypothetical protein BDCG_02496 [Blastomyces dermatitidis ER-3]EQL38341.1 hypothetical protein BDFG_00695 [Blastomyces dermatitidis ATCC 26199]OAT10075.1 hypothetical protein BDBG_05758 [Blastomyces gilchristii SLH14081]
MRPNHVIVLIVLLVPVFAFIVYRVVIHAAFVFYHNLAVNNMMLETRKAEEAIDAQEAEVAQATNLPPPGPQPAQAVQPGSPSTTANNGQPANVQPDNSGQTNPSQPANGPPGNGNGNAHGNGHVNANGNGQLANGHPPANGAGGGGGAAPPTAINGHP